MAKIKPYRSFIIRYSSVLFSLCCYFLTQAQQTKLHLTAHDGPYIIYKGDEAQLIRVREGAVQVQPHLHPTVDVITEDGKHSFQVSLHKIQTPDWHYTHQDGILVLSDPHGDFESLYAVLKAQKVIGDDYQWTFGKKHLVIIGDIFDRGKDVLPIFWLIYKLEAEAKQMGGAVHFILGNHEEMILRGNLKYTEDKYKALAQQLGYEYRNLWNNDSELGRWLLRRNTIEKIGDHLFVHAGLSADIVDRPWSISAINDSVRVYLYHSKEEREQSEAARFLFGSRGPLWYRGMVHKDPKYDPLSMADLTRIMTLYKVRDIYVGHTIFPEVSSFYDCKVYDVNVKNKSNREHGKSRGIYIQGDKRTLIFDNPAKNKIMRQ
jgi:metallophosphoesterase superfamily enzyme